MDKRCENCRYCEYENIDEGYVCVNDKSDYLADWVNLYGCCEEWSGKNEN